MTLIQSNMKATDWLPAGFVPDP